jgi:CHAT domain-containing protein
MRARRGGLCVLILLAVGVRGAFGEPAPPAEQAAEQKRLLARAKQLNEEGMRLYQRGDYARALAPWQQALALYRQAFSRQTHPRGHAYLARSLSNLGALHLAAADYARAEPLLREALAMWRALYPRKRFPAGHADLATGLNNLGNLHRMAGDYTQAEPLLREALAMRRALYPPQRFPKGHAVLAGSINNLGLLHSLTGDHARAESLFREALAMRRALYPRERFPDGHDDLAQSLSNLSTLHQWAGDYAQAEPPLREALTMLRALYPRERFPSGHPHLAFAINNLGNLHRNAGAYGKAEPLLSEALAMWRALYPREHFPAGHPDLAYGINNSGRLYHMTGDYGRAGPLYREALAMFRALYPRKAYPNGHDDLAVGLNDLGHLHLDAGEYARAEPLFVEALAMRRALSPRERFPAGRRELATSLHNLGVLHHDAGDDARAEPYLREALTMYDRLLRQFADLAAEAESRDFASIQPLCRDAFLSATRDLPGSAAAYEVLWDGRAVLTRLQERRHRDLLAGADPATAALADELGRTRRSLACLLLSPGRAADTRSQAALRLTQAKEDLEKRLAARLRLATLAPAAAATTVQQLGAALPAGAAFVDLLRYVSFDRDPRMPGKKGAKYTARYVAFVVGYGQAVARVELGEAARIEAKWSAWHKALFAPGGDQQRERAAARVMARLVWEPIRAVLPADCRTVYVTPDGVLVQLPWAALPGRKPDTILVDDCAVCLVPHGPWLLERLTAPASGGRKPPEDTLVAYGGIDYDGPPAAVAAGRGPRELELVGGGAAVPVRPEKRLHWAALPGTAREQAHIVDLARQALKDPPLVRRGRAASTEQLLQDLPRVRYAHLSTHGFFADPVYRSYLQVDPKLYERGGRAGPRAAGVRSPLVLSGLVLAGANRQGGNAAPDRGIVTAEALISLRLDGLELAVLSACETGLGEVAGGEGVFGLQRAFHVAGAKNVVASLWQVDDEATAALMALFYHHLWQEKRAPLEALRQAQLTLYHHPERIPQLARARGPDFEKAARLPVASGAASARRSPARLWAGFVFSGSGR